MTIDCNIPTQCNFWFCKNKGLCLLDKQSNTPKRFKHEIKKTKLKKLPPNQKHNERVAFREQWKQHPKRVVTLIENGHDAACACCFTLSDLTFDHVIPLNKGGSNLRSNGQILCDKCNYLKADLLLSIEELRFVYEIVGHTTLTRRFNQDKQLTL